MKRGITARQHEVLTYVSDYIAEHGYPPTLREIASHFGWASSLAAGDHLRALEKKGFITRTPMISRGLALTELGERELI